MFDQAVPVKYYILTFHGTSLGISEELTGGAVFKLKHEGKNKGMWEAIHNNQRKENSKLL